MTFEFSRDIIDMKGDVMTREDYKEVCYMAMDTIEEELRHFARDDTALITVSITMENGESISLTKDA